MEYEIRDETVLFDGSTNPSLHDELHAGGKPKLKRGFNSDDRERQRGEAIPEDDADPQMG